MIDFNDVKKKLLADPEVAQEYQLYKAEYDIARALIQARIKAGLTQGDVAKRMHTSQSQIARLESGAHFPSFQTIHKYAQAVNREIKIAIQPH
jgi:DNA-binding XRE family transcriptional regulator